MDLGFSAFAFGVFFLLLKSNVEEDALFVLGILQTTLGGAILLSFLQWWFPFLAVLWIVAFYVKLVVLPFVNGLLYLKMNDTITSYLASKNVDDLYRAE